MRIQRRTFGKLAAGAAAGLAAPAIAQNKPLTIGFSMNMTGPLAPNGKAALLAAQIWEGDINAKGGLLGRPVKLVYYDDASNPSNIPGLYTKLLDVDKVDIIASSYATNMIAPAMPIVMQHDRTFFSLLGLAVNSEFNYKRYFSMTPTGGPRPKESFAEGFFEVAAEQTPKPQTVAMCGADAEFPRNAMDGARQVIKRLGLKLVYDKTYPPNTTDYTPVVRAMAATNPDIFLACSYPADTVGLIKASHEVGFKPKIYGGGMVGLQATAIKTQLGPLLNGIVVYDFWLPWAGFASDDGREFVKKYQAKYHPVSELFDCTDRNLNYVLARAVKVAGINKRVTLQLLRDTFAVQQLKNGVPPETVREKLGLSDEAWLESREKYRRLAFPK